MLLIATVTLAAAEPQRWVVTGVTKGDTLTVRQSPSAKARPVGRFQPGTTGIEQLAEDEASGWMKVRSGLLEGWVNPRYLSPELPSTGTLPTTLTCNGTEPFWSVALKGGIGSYASPEKPEGTGVAVTVVRTTHDAAFLVTPAAGGGWSWLTVELSEQTCSDGMSDRRYPYRALALTDEQGFVAGCCRIP